MRVRVCLDFDILIESFISLCIIETVGAISRESNVTIGFFVAFSLLKKENNLNMLVTVMLLIVLAEAALR
jgi:hypothetical protein